jgi:diadenosine tetraphosphatase ApaH/serine/threonine PP2A family protein phosphatase
MRTNSVKLSELSRKEQELKKQLEEYSGRDAERLRAEREQVKAVSTGLGRDIDILRMTLLKDQRKLDQTSRLMSRNPTARTQKSSRLVALYSSLEEIFERLPKLVSESTRDYIAAFEPMIRAGDYVFVHAGIDPSRPLGEQKRSDLLWIRERFLSHEGPLEKVVVHGHTIFERVMDCGNRIGIDTGAFRSGVLTALVLEGEQRRIVQARTNDGGPVEIFHGDQAE